MSSKLEATRNYIRTMYSDGEELLSVYFEPVEPTAAKAVFMTASEIHAKLKMWGNITTPMPLNKFGELLKRRGYEQRALHGGKHGYVVKVIDNLADRQYQEIHEILSGASGASTFYISPRVYVYLLNYLHHLHHLPPGRR